MKFFKMLFVFVLVSLLGTTKVFAQESTGVALAKVAQPVATEMEAYNTCVAAIPESLSEKRYDKRVEICEKIANRQSKRSENVAKSAAKANQPQVVFGGGGYIYSDYDYSRPTRYSAGNNRRRSSGRSASYRTPN